MYPYNTISSINLYFSVSPLDLKTIREVNFYTNDLNGVNRFLNVDFYFILSGGLKNS